MDDFRFLTRIQYQAVFDKTWGKHEIAYVLFLKMKKITLDPNPDEISEIHWVSRKEITDFVKNIDSPLTPWFKLAYENQLLLWWDNLDKLDKFEDHSTIHRYLKV